METLNTENRDFYEDINYGKVPVGWKVKRLKDIFDFFPTSSYSRSKLIEQGEIGYIHYGDIHTQFDRVLDLKKDVVPFIPKELMKKYENLKDGDIVVSDASEDWTGVGKCIEIINIEDKKIISGLHTLHLRPKSVDFILGIKGYILSIYQVAVSIKSLATGMKVYGISKPNLGRVILPIPPKPEQTAIATILSKVDEAIETTRQSIKAAKKLKKALMQNLLAGKLKPDGTWRTDDEFYEDEKFGKVPVGWEIKKGKKIFKSFGSSTLDKVNLSKQGECIYMKVSDFNIEGNELFIEKANIMFSFDKNESLNYCEPNFIVMSKRGEAIRKNRVRLLAKRTLLDPNLMALKIIDGNPLFFKFLLEQMNLQRFLENSALPQLNNKDFYPRYYLYPPIDEQDEISNIILNQYNAIQSKQTKIQTLQRLRKSLMQNLLTGKVRLDVEAINKIISEE